MSDDFGTLVRRVVLEGEPETSEQFIEIFRPELEKFVRVAAHALHQGAEAAEKAVRSERTAWVFQYLYMAVNNGVVAVRLLVEGFFVPSGNVLRQLTEAVAVALLFASPRLPDFEEFLANPTGYRVSRTPFRVRDDEFGGEKVSKILDVDPKGWEVLLEARRGFHEMSHPSAVGASAVSMHDGSGKRDLGGNFDISKVEHYRNRLEFCISSVERITELYPHMFALLQGK